MNWIRQEKRLAIYLRDGCACAWCGVGIEQSGVTLTLDHVVPHVKGGGNGAENLVTSCKRCNDSRGARSVAKFATVTAAYLNHGVKAEDIKKHVAACPKRDLKEHVIAAKAMIARRGSAFEVLKTMQK